MRLTRLARLANPFCSTYDSPPPRYKVEDLNKDSKTIGRHIVRGTIPWQGSKVEDSQERPQKLRAARDVAPPSERLMP